MEESYIYGSVNMSEVTRDCFTPLMKAVEKNDKEMVAQLLSQGASVDEEPLYDTALTIACVCGHTNIADLLLERGAKLERKSTRGRTPLMIAARARHLDTVQLLINKGANVNQRGIVTADFEERKRHWKAHFRYSDEWYCTPLIQAATKGHVDIVKLLINHNADVNAQSTNGDTRLHYASCSDGCEMVNELLYARAKVKVHIVNGPTALMEAASVGHVEVAKLLLEAGACINSILWREDFMWDWPSEVESPLTLAVKGGHEKLVKLLIERGANIEGVIQGDYTPLMLAAREGQERMVALLISHGAQINAQTEMKDTALTLACRIGHQDTVQHLLRCGADMELGGLTPLMKAAQEGHLELVKLLIDKGALVQTQTWVERTAFLYACEGGHTAVAAFLLDKEAGLAQHDEFDSWYRIPLMVAAGQGNVDTVKFLIKNNADVNAQSFDGNTPLHSAVNGLDERRSGMVVSELLHVGAKVEVHNAKGRTPLMEAASAACEDVAKLLLEAGASIYTQSSLCKENAFTLACSRGYLPMVTLLLRAVENLEQPLNQINLGLMKACRHDHMAVAQLLLDSGAKVNVEADSSESPLTLAAKEGHVELAKLLMERDANIEGVIQGGYTPLMMAAWECRERMVALLLSRGANVHAQTAMGDTALTLTCVNGNDYFLHRGFMLVQTVVVEQLLDKGADIKQRDKKGLTPLMRAATSGHPQVVKTLLDHQADIEAQSKRCKDTALSLACKGDRYKVVEVLLKRGANKEHRNSKGYTPLCEAAWGGHVDIIKLLLRHGAEINPRTGSKLGTSPLMLASKYGHIEAVKVLLKMRSGVKAQIEACKNTALTQACLHGRHQVVSLLVDSRANIEHRSKNGLTPLMEAASGGYVEVGRVLLDKGAMVNTSPVPSSGDTALTIAANKGYSRFVELLVQKGADVNVKNTEGNSPLWLACNGGHLKAVRFLVNNGADKDSQDNHKVSCLMAAFRKGHDKVVEWMVKKVSQHPSDQELQCFINQLTDKEDLQKKCQSCMEIITHAKLHQAEEDKKNTPNLLQLLEEEKKIQAQRKAAQAAKRERRREKEKEKKEKKKNKKK